MSRLYTIEDLEKTVIPNKFKVFYATLLTDDFSYYDDIYSYECISSDELRRNIFIFPIIIKKTCNDILVGYAIDNSGIGTSFEAKSSIIYDAFLLDDKDIQTHKKYIDIEITKDDNYMHKCKLLKNNRNWLKIKYNLISLFENCTYFDGKQFNGYIINNLSNDKNKCNDNFYLNKDYLVYHDKDFQIIIFDEYNEAKYYLYQTLYLHILYCTDKINRKADDIKKEYFNLKKLC